MLVHGYPGAVTQLPQCSASSFLSKCHKLGFRSNTVNESGGLVFRNLQCFLLALGKASDQVYWV